MEWKPINHSDRGKRALAEESRKQIGSSDLFELRTPKGYKKLEVFADTETFYDLGGVKPWEWIGKKNGAAVLSTMVVVPFLIAWQYRNVGGEGNGEWVKDCRYIDDSLGAIHYFLGNLEWIYNELKLTPILYFHNASYDIPALVPMFRVLDPDLYVYFYVVKESKNFIRGCMQSKKYNFFCEFGDTLKYDRAMSIERAGEILGKPKIEGFPYGMGDLRLEGDEVVYVNIQTGEEERYPLYKGMEYAERDVDIMREFHLRRLALNKLENEQMVEGWAYVDQRRFQKKCGTRPQHSKHICNKYLETKDYGRVDDVFRFDLGQEYEEKEDVKDMYQRVIESNCGGFTSFNREIYRYECGMDRHIRYFDVNSMYPWIMTGGLPKGTILANKPTDTNDYTTWHCVSVRECKWKEGLGCIKNQAFSLEKMTGIPFFVESEYWKFVLENCEIEYTMEHTYYQRNTHILAGLINKYFDRRAAIKEIMARTPEDTPEYKSLDDTQNGLKILMNSLYGKMCEKGHHTNVVYNQTKYETFTSSEKVYPCILTGSFITYRARLTLLRKIKEVIESGYDFLYADTDSIIMGCPVDADTAPIFGKDDGLIGQWKNEGIFDLYLSVWKKKKYFLSNSETKKFKMAFSGIPKSVHRIIKSSLKDDFRGTIEDLKILFNPEENILIEKSKPISLLNVLDQQVLFNTDFAMNSQFRDPTGYMRITDKGYTIEKCITQ